MPNHFLIDSECVACENRAENSKSQVPFIVTGIMFLLLLGYKFWRRCPSCIRIRIERTIEFLDEARKSSFGATFKICAGFYQVCKR